MTELPERYATRPPSPEDAEEVVALMVACQLADTGGADMSLDELVDDWHGLNLAEEAVVVAAPDGRIAGYADVLNRSYVTVSVYGYVHPDHRGRGVGASLVAWGERWTREHMPLAPEGARVVVQHYINAANEGARRLLESLGYAPVRGVYVMETELDEAPPAPHWPDGISVHTFVPGRDERATYEAVEDAFKDLWGRPRNTFESFLRETERESFDPSLWHLARSGDEICGVALCKVLEGQGWVTVVGVRRQWRKRGLGLALLRHAFSEYHRRGVRKVALSVDAESITGAPRLYGRAGMRVRESYAIYLKELRPGVDLGDRSGTD
ncbi:MAG: GNAT family N-acetyltransferase [Actinomycetota bacterium]|nr:GNAT family N-acetyltransferase [Actinomycetota bacterium]